jgi:hypothetical protein
VTFDPSTLRERLRDPARRQSALDHARANALSPALLAFLREAPSDEATHRDVFATVADRLDPELAWSIARAAMERVGDGDAGSGTRHAMRRAALVRWAARVGEEAMPEVLAAISEDAETGLTALEVVAVHPETRREHVLDQIRPYVGHSSVVRQPALAALALRALAPEASPEDLGVPKAVAAAWNDAAITEASITETLVELGLISGRDVAPPSDRRRRLGRELVLDVLIRARVVASFDTESGFSPVPYAELFEETLAPLAHELAPIEIRVETTGPVYILRLAARGAAVDVRFEDESDYYDVGRILALWNTLFERAGASSRLHALTTGDQTGLVLCAPPKIARLLAKTFRLKLVKAS